jgi:hypothetical protein
MYRAACQAELTRALGVRWEAPDRWGNRSIQGMPEGLRRGFSKRHEQIAAELQRQEASGKHRTARLVQTVVHATRPPKSHETPEMLYDRWQQEARQLGFEPDRLVRDITGPARSREPDPAGTAGRPERSGGTPARLPERTVKTVFDRLASPEGLTEQASTFARRDVLCAVGRELPADVAGAVGPAELEALADRFLGERAVSVMGEHAIGERHYATPEWLAVEHRLIDAAVSRAGEQTGVCSHESLRAALAANSTIGADQAAMVRDIAQGGQGVAVVVGKAGTGKTYARSSTATASSVPHPPGLPRCVWTLRGSSIPALSTRCLASWTRSTPTTGDAARANDQNN